MRDSGNVGGTKYKKQHITRAAKIQKKQQSIAARTMRLRVVMVVIALALMPFTLSYHISRVQTKGGPSRTFSRLDMLEPAIIAELVVGPLIVFGAQIFNRQEIDKIQTKFDSLEKTLNITMEIESDMRGSLEAYRNLYDSVDGRLNKVAKEGLKRKGFVDNLVESVTKVDAEVEKKIETLRAMSLELDAKRAAVASEAAAAAAASAAIAETAAASAALATASKSTDLVVFDASALGEIEASIDVYEKMIRDSGNLLKQIKTSIDETTSDNSNSIKSKSKTEEEEEQFEQEQARNLEALQARLAEVTQRNQQLADEAVVTEAEMRALMAQARAQLGSMESSLQGAEGAVSGLVDLQAKEARESLQALSETVMAEISVLRDQIQSTSLDLDDAVETFSRGEGDLLAQFEVIASDAVQTSRTKIEALEARERALTGELATLAADGIARDSNLSQLTQRVAESDKSNEMLMRSALAQASVDLLNAESGLKAYFSVMTRKSSAALTSEMQAAQKELGEQIAAGVKQLQSDETQLIERRVGDTAATVERVKAQSQRNGEYLADKVTKELKSWQEGSNAKLDVVAAQVQAIEDSLESQIEEVVERRSFRASLGKAFGRVSQKFRRRKE